MPQIPSCPPASRLIDGSCPSHRPTRHDVAETASSDDRSASLKLKFVARSVVLLPLYQSSVPRICGVSRYLHIRTIRSIQFKLVSLDWKLTQKIPPSKDHVSFKSCLPGLPPASEPHAKLVVAALMWREQSGDNAKSEASINLVLLSSQWCLHFF
jgi:hypothetical protein